MPNEPTFLIWILVVFVLVLFTALVWTASKLRMISRDLQRLTRTLDKVESRVAEQERQLAEVRAALERRGGDMFAPFLEAFQQVKSKGWMAALTLIGGHLFRSYLSKRRQKSLPDKKDP